MNSYASETRYGGGKTTVAPASVRCAPRARAAPSKRQTPQRRYALLFLRTSRRHCAMRDGGLLANVSFSESTGGNISRTSISCQRSSKMARHRNRNIFATFSRPARARRMHCPLPRLRAAPPRITYCITRTHASFCRCACVPCAPLACVRGASAQNISRKRRAPLNGHRSSRLGGFVFYLQWCLGVKASPKATSYLMADSNSASAGGMAEHGASRPAPSRNAQRKLAGSSAGDNGAQILKKDIGWPVAVLSKIGGKAAAALSAEERSSFNPHRQRITSWR